MTKEGKAARRRYQNAMQKAFLSGDMKLLARMITAIIDGDVKRAAKYVLKAEALQYGSSLSKH